MTDVSPSDKPFSKLREREAELDRRASLIDTHTDLSFGETLEVAARGMFLARHFLGRFILKLTLMFFAIAVPLVMLPWPIKILIDHVVLGTPIEEATGYPPIWRPFLDALAGSGPLEVLVAVMAVLALFVLLIGGYSQGDNARDETEGNLAEGHGHGHQGREQPARRAQLRRRHLWLYRFQDQHAPHPVSEPLLPGPVVRADQGVADDDPGGSAHRRQRLPRHVRRAGHQPGLLRDLVCHRDGDGGHVHGHRHVHERLPRIARLHSSPRLRVPVHLLAVRRLRAHGATARPVVAGVGRHHHQHHRRGHGQHPRGAEPGRQPQGEGAVRRR